MSPDAGKEAPVCEPGERRAVGLQGQGRWGLRVSVWAAKGLQGLLTTPILPAVLRGC